MFSGSKGEINPGYFNPLSPSASSTQDMTETNDVFISVSLFTMRGSRRVATYPVPRMISPAITQDNTGWWSQAALLHSWHSMSGRHQVSPVIHQPLWSQCRWLHSIINLRTPPSLPTRGQIEDRNMSWENTWEDGKIVDNKRMRSFWYCEKGGKTDQ